MKKWLISFIMVLLLVCSMPCTAFASEMEDDENSSETHEERLESSAVLLGRNDSELGPNSSLQLMFAKLQLELSETLKTQALDRMEQITKCQEEQKLVSQFLNEARHAQSDAKSTGKANNMSPEMAKYMDDNGLSYDTTGDDLLMTADEWDSAITALESHLEELGRDIQQEMVYVQDFIGQYHSYLQGTNIQNSNTNQTLTSLARGQSMYGNSDAGLTVTALVGGMVLGCLITLAAQKLSRKKDKS